MCGIVAVFADAPRPELGTWLTASLQRIQHRGPDGSGQVLGRETSVLPKPAAATWGLGHARLAILDLSDNGRQPMSGADGRHWVTFNGEIYNFLELRKTLQAEGYRFHSQSDTEVLLAAYDRWGAECTKHFIGMFAFVLVDLQRQTVFVARDRLGVKPLYVWQSGNLTAFVSEIKQLRVFPDFAPKANLNVVMDFLVDAVNCHNPTETFFADVAAFPPAHALTFRLAKPPRLEQADRYWIPRLESRRMSWDEAVESTRDAFRQAIRLALRSDVPVGCCLSGGIDSSSIVGTVTREFGIPMHTFSACWNTAECDEQFYIDAVARHCHTIPHKVFPSEAEAIVDLDALVGCHDEPVGGGAQYAQWRVMQLARQNGVKVLLDGQGGDECLCGYNKYRYFYLRWLLARRRGLTATAHVIDSLRWGDQGLLRLAQGQRYLPRLLRRCYPQVAALLRPAWRKLQRNTWAQRMRGVTDIHEHQLADLQHWSLPLLLRAEDRNSMAHSVESRVPMVDDHRFVEHCLTLPEETFFRCGKTKRLLTEGMGKALPEEVHQRRTKMGYNTPQARWMKGRLGHVLEQRVRQSSRLAELIDTQAAAGTFVAYRNGARSVGEAALYRIADLAMWLERFGVDFAMDSPAAVSGPLRRAA